LNAERMRNYYKILNIPYNANQGDIKSAYRRLAKRYHPDVTNRRIDDFIRLKEAFDVLSDTRKRRLYDNKLNLNIYNWTPYQTDRVNVHREKQDVFDDLVDVVSDRFHIAKKKKLHFDLFLTDEEFEKGLKTTVTVPRDKICPRCFGFGGTIISTCCNCNGLGMIKNDIELEIKLTPPLSLGQEYEITDKNNIMRFCLRRSK